MFQVFTTGAETGGAETGDTHVLDFTLPKGMGTNIQRRIGDREGLRRFGPDNSFAAG